MTFLLASVLVVAIQIAYRPGWLDGMAIAFGIGLLGGLSAHASRRDFRDSMGKGRKP